MSIEESKVLCHIDDIDEGTTKGFLANDAGQDLLFIVKVKGQIFAWRNACPHVLGAPMAWRKDAYMDAKKQHVACHAHGALFEPDSGLCIQGPCLGKTLEKVPVYINHMGMVSILLTDIH
ncbi:Rieske (2Fe-2S) protein [Marinomonas shanghaiensis]|jgi:nitrite reductase/ring-hydroxylating ferredoxin subunit|uniref:Rieske (2Fe-2S) protein n=1 Tax=Marinomonas shanghaiensis TaxID=2202418 RepID=UPI003A93E93D